MPSVVLGNVDTPVISVIIQIIEIVASYYRRLKMSLKIKMFFLIFFVMFISSCMTASPNLQVINGETRMTLTQSAPISRGADISSDGKYLLTGGIGVFTHWDISRGMLINRYSAELPQIMGTWLTTGLIPVAFTAQGKQALSGGEKLLLWDLASGKVLRKYGNDPATTIGVSSGGKLFLTCEESEWAFKDSKMILYDANSGEKITEWNMAGNVGAGIMALSPDGKYALSSGGGGRKSERHDRGVIYLWDVSRGRRINSFDGTGQNKGLGEAVLAMAFSPDSKRVLSGGTDGSVRMWDIASGRELITIQGHKGTVGTKAVAFSPDGKLILSVGGSDGLAKLWDITSGSLVRTFKVSDDRFVAIRRMGGIINGWVAFTPDSKRIIFMGSDASFRIFDVATGNEVATLVLFDDGEWLVVTAEGYYNASEKGAQHLKVQYEGKDYDVDQFYDVFYRPDIVAAKLSGQDINGLISITMKDATKNPPPAIEFTSKISNTEEQPKVKVCYKVKSAGGGIGEVRLFHNGKLIQSDGYYRDIAKTVFTAQPQLVSMTSKAIYEDMRSISVKDKLNSVSESGSLKGEVYETCQEVEAIPGENELSLSAFNGTNTVQSYMKTVSFKSSVKSEEPHLYILAVGIDRHKDSTINLKYAVKDAKDIEQKLRIQSETLFKPSTIHCTLVTDQEASKKGISGKINDLARVIKPNDSFILFVAGHGVLLQNQYYLITSDYNGNVSENSVISSNEIVEMSKKIKSLSQLFIFDTCHAGGVDTIISGLYDARMSVLAKKMGLHIYASASDKQAAMDGFKGNGLFTYTLLDGLNNNRAADKNKDGKVSIVGLGEYSKTMTTSISKQIGHEQTPLIINFGKDYPLYQLR